MSKTEPTYDEPQITERLRELPGWYYEKGWIKRVYKTDGWPTTLMLVTAIGYCAEAAYHHPDLAVTWGRVVVKLSTHSAGGIHRQGFRARPAYRRGGPLAARGRRTHRHARQVRAKRRSTHMMDDPDGGTGRSEPRRVLFVTGRLAEPALRRVIDEMAPPFAYDIVVLGITVAALMTTSWIARHLHVPKGVDLLLIPGLCEGDLQVIADTFGVRVERGPKDLHQIPTHFGRAAVQHYGAWDIEIVAEINNVPRLTREAIRGAAAYLHHSGADVVDLGCTPGLAFPALADVVRELTGSGMRVSVDTFNPDEIRTAVAAGAELVLSVNGSNIDVTRELSATNTRVVVVPDQGGGLDTLEPTVTKLARWGVHFLIDPILEPVSCGFLASLERYAEVRRRYPDAEMLMGIGNVTELTAADSTGVNAILIAICQELGVRTVLTTEVIPWARGVVREVDVARRLMHYAITQHTPPKGVDNRLAHGQGRGTARVQRRRAPDPAGKHHRLQLPHLRRPRRDHGAQRQAVRPRHGHSGHLHSARGRRDDARVLPGQGAGAGEPRGGTREDVPPGGSAGVGVSDTAGRNDVGPRTADATTGAGTPPCHGRQHGCGPTTSQRRPRHANGSVCRRD